jgi:DNA polymerase-1
MHRAYHALPPFKTKSGIPTNIVYGFFSILQKSIVDYKPTHVMICFDTPAPTFRNKLLKEYQAQRPQIADDFIPQIAIVKELLDRIPVVRRELDGYEGDDVIGTVTKKANDEQFRVLILTGDKDMMQLVNDTTSTVSPEIGFSKAMMYTPASVQTKMGVPPTQIADLKALAGDPSDNYKGAEGVGPKTAQKLLATYGTVENLLAHAMELPEGRIKKSIMDHKQDIVVGKKLASIVTTAPIAINLSQTAWTGFSEPFKEKMIELEMYSLVARLFPRPKKTPAVKKEKEQSKDQISLF